MTPEYRHPDDRGVLEDEAAGPLVRPYAVTGGRTEPSVPMTLMTMVYQTGSHTPATVEPDLVEVMTACLQPRIVAEVAAVVRLPVPVAKVLLSDLIDAGAVQAIAPMPDTPWRRWEAPPQQQALPPMETLERLLAGLERRL